MAEDGHLAVAQEAAAVVQAQALAGPRIVACQVVHDEPHRHACNHIPAQDDSEVQLASLLNIKNHLLVSSWLYIAIRCATIKDGYSALF